MISLLDFSKPLDVPLLEEAVTRFYSTPDTETQNILVTFSESPHAQTTVIDILQKSQKSETKSFGLNILLRCIKFRQNSLPMNQRSGVRDYVVSLLISLVNRTSESQPSNNGSMNGTETTNTLGDNSSNSSQNNISEKDKTLIPLLNRIVVEIAKHDWPQGQPEFIPDLVRSSKQNEALCTNNMSIFLLLSEEVFESQDEITQNKLKIMKSSLNEQFSFVFDLFMVIMSSSENPILLEKMLKSLLAFLSQIPLGYIFETPLIENLAVKFFQHIPFQNIVLQCLTEIASLRIRDHPKQAEYTATLVKMFKLVIVRSSETLNLENQGDISTTFAKGQKMYQFFIRHLANFITKIFQEHLKVLENFDKESGRIVLLSHETLLRITAVKDTVIFRICLDYWLFLTKDLYSIMVKKPIPLLLGRSDASSMDSMRLISYKQAMTNLRLLLISKMARPKEVLIVEDENGNLIKQDVKDGDAITLYTQMRECLIYLTHLDPEDTQKLMINKLYRQMDGSEYSQNKLNTLCQAIGSISGAMNVEVEKQFLVSVIKDLLQLCDQKRGKEHKAIIATNIMYVVGQYPRFLRQHWKFLKTVANKLFEFMHEKFPGVQEMAVDTFLSISRKCKEQFVKIQIECNETIPFVHIIIRDLAEIVVDMEPEFIQMFYEAVATIIFAEKDGENRAMLIMNLMELPNKDFGRVVTYAQNNFDFLIQQPAISDLISIMRINNRAAAGLKQYFIVQFAKIFVEMLQVYKVLSEFVSGKIAESGPQVTQYHLIRQVRTVKSEILQLTETFVRNSKDSATLDTITKEIVPQLLDPVLCDYQRSVQNARDQQVLSLIAVIVDKLGERISSNIQQILETLFKPTLDMITKNPDGFPDHRIKFFELLRVTNKHCLDVVIKLGIDDFRYIMNAMLQAIKHVDRNTAEKGLEILLQMIKSIRQSNVANDFFKTYLNLLINEVFIILTDTFHKPGFQLQAEILAALFAIVESGQMTCQLQSSENGQNFISNQDYLRSYVNDLIASSFKENLTSENVREFVSGLFSFCTKPKEFKLHLRDFLITLKEFKGDNSDLYLEEKRLKEQQNTILQQQQASQIPGLLKQE